MADITITAANVKKSATSLTETGIAGATVTAGQTLYLAASGKLLLADADSATAEVRVVKGIALHAALLDQPLQYTTGGKMAIGATVAAGTPYFASPIAGGIAPLADLLTGAFGTFLGWGVSTTEILVDISAAGVAKA